MRSRPLQVCSNRILVNIRNVCRLVNAVADCTVNELKQAGLEYICLNLEGMLEQR
jgi:inhibitor of Bruton tyrosine kinase